MKIATIREDGSCNDNDGDSSDGCRISSRGNNNSGKMNGGGCCRINGRRSGCNNITQLSVEKGVGR